MKNNYLKFLIVLFVLTVLMFTPKKDSLLVKQKIYSDQAGAVVSATDVSSGKFTVEIRNFTIDASNVRVAVWSEKNGQDDIVWSDAYKKDGVYSADVSLKQHKFDDGKYLIHVYYNNDKFLGGIKKDIVVNKGEFVNQSVNSSTYSVSLNNSDYVYDESIEFAVWSVDGGQNDIRWYKASHDENNIYVNIPLKNHRSLGQYLVHVYGHDSNGNAFFVKSTSFVINGPSVDKSDILTPVFDPDTNELVVSVRNIQSDSGISKVQIPTWINGDSPSWYDAYYDDNDSCWKLKLNIEKYDFRKGFYKSHIYVTDEMGIIKFVGSTSLDVVPKQSLAVEVDSEEKGFTINYGRYSNYKGYTLQAAVWSEKDGQDDINWYNLKNGTYSALFEDFLGKDGTIAKGKYLVHLYANKNGKSKFLESTGFNVSNPKGIEVISSEVNGSKFTITVNNVPSSVSSVQVPVWSEKGGQDDVVWYNATKDRVNEGMYTVTVDIKNHKFDDGLYNIHVYVNKNGKKTNVARITKTVSYNKGEVKPEDIINDKDTNVKIAVSNSAFYTSKIRFAVWSEKGGTDDQIWYDGTASSDGRVVCNIPIKNHKTSGKYIVHVYGFDNKGNAVFITSASFDISAPTGIVSIDNIDAEGNNEDNIIYRVKVSNINSVSGLDKVRVPVWSDKNQNDIKWYDATIDPEDGTSYIVNVNPKYHKYHSGTYYTHVYIYGKNGVSERVIGNETTINLKPKIENKNGLAVKIDKGRYRIHVINSSQNIKQVSVGAFSDPGGQDDVAWYEGKKQSDGSWYVYIKALSHLPFGKVNSIVYFNKDSSKNPQASFWLVYNTEKTQLKPTYYSQVYGWWGSERFGNWDMANTGCVPTSIAMAFDGILDNTVNPHDVATYLYNNTTDFNRRFIGGGGYAFRNACQGFAQGNLKSVKYRGLGSIGEVRDAINNGAIVVALVGKGTFVRGNNTTHAIVLFGPMKGDNPIVYDPYDLNRPWKREDVSLGTIWNERSRSYLDAEGGYVFHELY